MIGLFSIMSVLEPPETQNIACTVDSVLDRLIVASIDAFVKLRDGGH